MNLNDEFSVNFPNISKREIELETLSLEIDKHSNYSEDKIPEIAKYYKITEMLDDLNGNLLEISKYCSFSYTNR